jgi:hypothetical protein
VSVRAVLTRRQTSERFYDTMGRAFAYLEEEVARGRIQYYGVSSNALAVASTAPAYVSLDRLLRTAQSGAFGEAYFRGRGCADRVAVSPTHHFRVVQYPMNLVEGDAAVVPNIQAGPRQLTVAQFAVVRPVACETPSGVVV